jgi:putative thioredoxin
MGRLAEKKGLPMTTIRATTPPATTAVVLDVDEQTFEREVLLRSRDVPVVVDLWAPWCGPCRTLSPILERLADEANGAWVLAKVNVDENPRLAQMFRAQSIPAVKAVVNGKLVDEFVGALPESQVRAWLKRFVKEPEPPQASLLEAAQALEATNPSEAAARYRLLLGEEPENAAALFNLGRLLLLQGETEGEQTLKQVKPGTPFYPRAQAMLPLSAFIALGNEGSEASLANSVAQTPSDLEGRYRLASHLTRRQAYGEAMDQLLAIVARDRAFRDDSARKTLIGLFEALGDEHELVGSYRRKLANTLF